MEAAEIPLSGPAGSRIRLRLNKGTSRPAPGEDAPAEGELQDALLQEAVEEEERLRLENQYTSHGQLSSEATELMRPPDHHQYRDPETKRIFLVGGADGGVEFISFKESEILPEDQRSEETTVVRFERYIKDTVVNGASKYFVWNRVDWLVELDENHEAIKHWDDLPPQEADQAKISELRDMLDRVIADPSRKRA